MTNKFSFNKIYWNPNAYINDYEKGISHGMAYMVNRLIWAQECYLDAKEAMESNGLTTEEGIKQLKLTVLETLNKNLQNFQMKSKTIDLFEDEKTIDKFNKICDLLKKEYGS